MKSLQSQSLSIGALLLFLLSANVLKLAEANPFIPKRVALPLVNRGGSTRALNHQEEDDKVDERGDADDQRQENDDEDPEVQKRKSLLQKYHMEQQMLMQVRSTILSEALAKRGLPMVTIMDVSTAEGDKPPDMVDWDCAMSTQDDPKTCLYSFDAEPNTKVIAPIGTTQWISVSALNRLRRTDPTKVEPMWHSQYAIRKSWFGDDSSFSVLQHCGPTGLVLALLLDHAMVLKALLTTAMILAILIFLPILDFWMSRMLVSSTIWINWPQWARIVHAALPLKLLLGQMGFKFLANLFGKVEQRVRDALVELECVNLEQCIPLTVGPGSEVIEIEIEEDEEDEKDTDTDKDNDDGTIVLDEDRDDDFGIVLDDDAALDELIEGLVGDDFSGDED